MSVYPYQVYNPQSMSTVLCHGVWDIFHPGHLQHLKEAKAFGGDHTVLVVSVTADEYVDKGPGRPLYTQQERADMLMGLKIVDEVIKTSTPTAVEAIAHVKPDFYVKGADYAGQDDRILQVETIATESVGGTVKFTSTPMMSSTQIINNSTPRLPDTTIDYLRSFPYTAEQIIEWLDKALTVHPMAIGEGIIDEYRYISPHGRSAKDSIVTFEENGAETAEGGIWAVESNLRAVVDKVSMWNGYKRPDGFRVHKTRWVERVGMVKRFGVAEIIGAPLEYPSGDQDVDMFVIADYGHGLITEDVQRQIFNAEKFIALTVQANSMNWGMNTFGQWDHASYITGDEAEFRLAFQAHHRPFDEVVNAMGEMLKADRVIMTFGHEGCFYADPGTSGEMPAFASDVVDRIGAGDAFLAASAPLAYLDAPVEIVAFVGSVAAAIQVGRVSNSKPIERKEIRSWVKSLLNV